MTTDLFGDGPRLNTISAEAARWTARLNAEDFTEIERRAFVRWILADPRHEKEFRACLAVSQMIRKVLTDNAARTVHETPVATRGAPSSTRARRRKWAVGLAAAAVLVMAVLAGRLWTQTAAATKNLYVTATGETRTIAFADGSTVQLNTRTRLQWIDVAHARRIDLLEGEAYFDVRRDASRPFYVRVEGGEIQVLGTRFNVYRKVNGQVIVSVADGAVNVRQHTDANGAPALWQQELRANQQMTFSSTGWLSGVRSVDTRNIVRWREGELKLENEPLADVIEELKRYTSRRIVIADPRLAPIGIGGAFSIHNTRSALDLIARAAPMTVKETRDAFVLSYRQKAPQRTGEQ